MTIADNYFQTVDEASMQVGFMDEMFSLTDDALYGLEQWLLTPGRIRDELEKGTSKLDLPDTLVSLLGFVPYVGTALKTMAKIVDASAEEIQDQADRMDDLDTAWQPYRDDVDTADNVLDRVTALFDPIKEKTEARAQESAYLQAALTGSEVRDDSRLAGKMAEYTAIYDAWAEAFPDVTAPVRELATDFQNAVNAFGAMIPDVSDISDAFSDALKEIEPVVELMQELEDALCIDIFGLGNLCDYLDDIAGLAGWIVDIIEDIVLDVLSLLGVDIDDMVDELSDAILAPFQPILDAFSVMEQAAASLFSAATDQFDLLVAEIENTVAAFDGMMPTGALFSNVIAVAGIPDAGVDYSSAEGTKSVDALFGDAAKNLLSAKGTGDFLFGHDGDDTLQALNGKNHELYGGAGDDTLEVRAGTHLLDGGADDDLLDGAAGTQTMLGGNRRRHDQRQRGRGPDRRRRRVRFDRRRSGRRYGHGRR